MNKKFKKPKKNDKIKNNLKEEEMNEANEKTVI